MNRNSRANPSTPGHKGELKAMMNQLKINEKAIQNIEAKLVNALDYLRLGHNHAGTPDYEVYSGVEI